MGKISFRGRLPAPFPPQKFVSSAANNVSSLFSWPRLRDLTCRDKAFFVFKLTPFFRLPVGTGSFSFCTLVKTSLLPPSGLWVWFSKKRCEKSGRSCDVCAAFVNLKLVISTVKWDDVDFRLNGLKIWDLCEICFFLKFYHSWIFLSAGWRSFQFSIVINPHSIHCIHFFSLLF